LAKPNYQFEKRQRDLAKKTKQEEKRRQKLAGKAVDSSDDGVTTGDSTPSNAVTDVPASGVASSE
jgi:hypothetical protein